MKLRLALTFFLVAGLNLAVAQSFERNNPEAVVRAYVAVDDGARQAGARLADYCIAAPASFPEITIVRVLSPHGETCVIMGAFVGARFERMSGETILWRHGQQQLQAQGWRSGDARERERLAVAWVVEALLPSPHARVAGAPLAQSRPDGGVHVTVPVSAIDGRGGDPRLMRSIVVPGAFTFTAEGVMSADPAPR